MHMSLIPAFRKQRQIELCESEAHLVYLESSRPAQDYPVRPFLTYSKNNIRNDIFPITLGNKILSNKLSKNYEKPVYKKPKHIHESEELK